MATSTEAPDALPTPALDAPTLCAAFQHTAAQRPDAVALRTPGDRLTITWREYAQRVERIAGGLAALGVGRGDTVGLMLVNRPEFNLVDTAALHLGATPFSAYNSLPAEQLAYVLRNAGNRVLFTERRFAEVVAAARRDVPAIEHVVLVDGEIGEDDLTLAELEDRTPSAFSFEAA